MPAGLHIVRRAALTALAVLAPLAVTLAATAALGLRGEAAEPARLDLAPAAHPAIGEAFRWPLPAWMPPPPAPEDVTMTPERVEVGRHIFHDARLSADGTTACASCHVQALAFTDGRTVSEGVHAMQGKRNVPSLANVRYMPTLTWANPHFTTLEFEALAPLFGTEPVEMGLAGQEAALFARLAADPWYAEAFPAAFSDRPQPGL